MKAVDYVDDRRAIRDALSGYDQLGARRVAEGWRPYLVTMLFGDIPGKPDAVLRQMLDEAERIYSTLMTRVVRRPLSSRSVDELPIVIAAPDLPVGKRDKPLVQVALNDGLHLHAILLMPPHSRLPVPADEHFRRQQALYVRDRRRLHGVDVCPIEDTVERAVAYVLKSVRRRTFSYDDVLVLPRAISELRG
jgi:hypothetical protein